MLKRALSVLLVLLMVFALCSVAVADEAKKNEKEETVYWIDLDTGYYIISHDGQPHLKEVDHVQYGPDHVTYYGWGLYGGLIMGNTQQERGEAPKENNSDTDPDKGVPWHLLTYTWVNIKTGASYTVNDGKRHLWFEHLKELDHFDLVYPVFYMYGTGLDIANTVQERGTYSDEKNECPDVPVLFDMLFTWYDLDTGASYTAKGLGHPLYPGLNQHWWFEHLTEEYYLGPQYHYNGDLYHVCFFGYGLHDCPWVAIDVEVDNGPEEKGTGGKDTDNMQPAQGEDKKDKLSVPSTVCFYTWWDLDTGGRYTVKGIGYPYYPEYWQHAPHEHLTTFHHFTGSENPYHVIFYGYGLHDCPWIAKDVKIDNGPAEW